MNGYGILLVFIIGHCEMNNRIHDLTGKIFTNLTVLELAEDRTHCGGCVWTCKCTCGNIVKATSTGLKSGNNKSCGCLQKISWIKNRPKPLPRGEGAFNSIYYKYKRRAKSKGINFELNKQQFRTLTSQPCKYCGETDSNLNNSKGNNGGFRYNGIDRVDNAKGYTEENSVPCCKLCNRMKNNMSLDEFIAHIKKLWECSVCGTQHYRDINAAKVILNTGLGWSLDNTGTHAVKPETFRLE